MITRKPDGTMLFDSSEEAIDYEIGLQMRVKKLGPNVTIYKGKPKPESAEADEVDDWEHIKATMVAYDGRVVDTATMAQILRISNLQGVGTKLRHLHNRMMESGVDIHKYLIKQRASDGTPSWLVDASGSGMM